MSPLAADKGDFLAVGRRRWADRSADPSHRRFGIAGFDVIAFNIENLAVGILRILENGAGRDVARVINMPAIGRKDWLTQFLLVLLIRPLDQQDACAAGNMVEPDFACS